MPYEYDVTDVDVYVDEDGRFIVYGYHASADCGQNTAKLRVMPAGLAEADRENIKALKRELATKISSKSRPPQD